MDVALLFFLPLIAGFRFVQTCVFTSYRAARQDTQRLYYQAAVWGIVLAVLGFFLHRWASGWSWYRPIATGVIDGFVSPLLERTSASGTPIDSKATAAIRVDLAFACGWALLLGLATPLFNRLVAAIYAGWTLLTAVDERPRSLVSAVNYLSITDQFEMLLADALRRAGQIQCTLSNQKVYVGWVTQSPNPLGQEKYFRIQPSMSGFRSKDDGRVTFTTYYDDILQKYKTDPERLRWYEIVIPMDKIVSAAGFDLTAYVEFQKKPRAEPAAPDKPNETQLSGNVTVHLERPLRRT